MFTKASIVAILATVALAQKPTAPSGNPIRAPLSEIVPACKAFTIRWDPTSAGPITIQLLRGPSTNVVPIDTLVSGVANSGSFVWTPSASLEADVSRYGLQITDDVTGNFQYSNQFGISKGPECNGFVASSASSSPYNGGGYPVSTPAPSSAKPTSSAVPTSKANSTTIVTKTSSTPVVVSSGYPAVNSTIVLPSKSLSVPSSLLGGATGSASPTRSAPAQSTGGASTLSAGFSLFGAIAAMAYML